MNSRIDCGACGAGGPFSRHCVREMNFGSEEPFWYLECVNCSTLQIGAVPPDLSRHYPPEYLGSDHSYDPASAETLRKAIRDFVLRQRTAYLLLGWTPIGWAANKRYKDDLAPHLVALRPINLRKKERILDVGCGPGYLLHRLRQNGYQYLVGQDPFQGWTIPDIGVHKGRLKDLRGQFDLIMLHHSLEHAPDPLQLLIDLKRLLAPGGSLLVRIPLAASEAWMQYDVNWYQIDAPRHLVIPSRKGMCILVKRAGFEVLQVRYDSDETQFLCSEQYRRGIPLRDSRSYYNNPHQTLFNHSEIAAAKARSRKVNKKKRGDQGCFYLRAVS
jgi:SAM-dependent methyltransferase